MELPVIVCKAMRPSTGSKIEIQMPFQVVQSVQTTNDITLATEWVGKEFDWQFIPMSFEIVENNENHNHNQNQE
jgi:hypothetical protein